MATVAELTAEAKALGIKGYSRMRKAEIEQAIADARKAESEPNKIDNATPSATPAVTLTRAERAAQAGARGVSATPLPNAIRQAHYHSDNGHGQTFRATPAQSRRMRRKAHKMTGMIPAGQR